MSPVKISNLGNETRPSDLSLLKACIVDIGHVNGCDAGSGESDGDGASNALQNTDWRLEELFMGPTGEGTTQSSSYYQSSSIQALVRRALDVQGCVPKIRKLVWK